uniref:Uncharacterized protein n=1 Tax=Timema cristinae TaxID=61476 RepID=A0A7R9H2Z6_TIMCR|nr:unnamed protein product [Timema cristinae]
MAIVAMVARGATEDEIRPSSGACAHVPSTINLTSISNTTVQEPTEEGGEFIWDDMQQSLILGSFFWGYLLFQVPGGLLAEVYGPKVVLGGSVFINGALSVLLPLATRQHWYLLLVIRAMQGVAQGAQYPVLSAAVVRWVPLEERARFVSFAVQGISQSSKEYLAMWWINIIRFSEDAPPALLSSLHFSQSTTDNKNGPDCGASLGTVLALPLCGVVVSTWGWEAVFYGSGLIAAAWCLAWAGLVFDSPDQHPRISRKECLYLRDHLPCTPPGRLPVPWRRVWSSRQFLIACVAALGNDWGFHTLITLGPKYMKENLGFDLEQRNQREEGSWGDGMTLEHWDVNETSPVNRTSCKRLKIEALNRLR